MNSKYIIHNYLNLNSESNLEFKKKLIANISNSEIKNGGFDLKKYLSQKINSFVTTAKGKGNKVIFDEAASNAIQEKVEHNLEKAMQVLDNSNVVHVYLIPTLNQFLKEYMDGIQGWCPSKNAIHLYIHPDCNKNIALIETLVHEYNHTVFRSYHLWNKVEEGLVAEGLAEHFRLELVGGKRAKWTEVLNEKESMFWLEKIKPVLKSESFEDYNNVFTNFDEEPYPLWTGYTVGYYLIEKYRKINKSVWNEIMKVEIEIITG